MKVVVRSENLANGPRLQVRISMEGSLKPHFAHVNKALGGFYRRLRERIGAGRGTQSESLQSQRIGTEAWLLRNLANQQGFTRVPSLAKRTQVHGEGAR